MCQINTIGASVWFTGVYPARVGTTYYMSSTTMHMSPGLPIMKSKDLANWEMVGYAYDTLASVDALNLANGKSTYGRGSWASSLRFHNGTYYVTTFAQTTGKTYIYTTKNIEKGPWKAASFAPAYHDHSLFFDDDGRVYMIYGAGKLRLVELTADASSIKPGTTEQVIIENASTPSGTGGGLPAEGSQLFKVNGKYYLFNITWPKGGMRTVVIHRADKLTGPWEGRIGLQDLGVAQGGLIDTPDGKWFAYLFRDFGGVGRIPYLVPVIWEEGWPVLGVNGKVPETLDLPASKGLIPGIVASDEFTRKKGDPALPLVWQWNHNPDNQLWSVNERKGHLRLKTGRIDTSFVLARNTITQRTIGPESSGSTALDVYQGESNTNDSLWTKKVKIVYDNLMKDLKLKPRKVSLLAGETVNADQGVICASMNRIIATLPQTIKNAHVISSAGCTDAADNLHFNAAGYRELGKRYAVQMLSLLGYKDKVKE